MRTQFKNFSPFYENPRVHYRVHKRLPPVVILCQKDLVYNAPHYFPKNHLNVILPATPKSPQWHLPFWLSHRNPPYVALLYACYIHHYNYIWLMEFSQPPNIMFHLGPHILLSATFSNTFSLCSSSDCQMQSFTTIQNYMHISVLYI
jgi:hypothetical protein